MAKTADVHRSIWSEPWFLAFPPDAKCLFLWAITNEHGNLAVMYVVAEETILHETKLTRARFEKALEQTHPKFLYDRETAAVWVPGAAKLVRTKNERTAKGVVAAVEQCPCPSFQVAFIEKYGQHVWLSGLLSDLALRLNIREPHQAFESSFELHGQGHSHSHKEERGSGGEKDDPVRQVFSAWVESKGKNSTGNQLDSDRRKLIAKWLKVYPVEDLCDAVYGWRYSPHHRGENDRKTVYNGLKHCLRDSDRIEEFRDLTRTARARRAGDSKLLTASERRERGLA